MQRRAEETIRSMGGNVHISPQRATWWQRLAGPAYTTYGETEVAFIMGPMGDAELAVLGRHLPNLPQLKRLILGHAFRDGTEPLFCFWHDDVGRHAEYLRNQPPCADTEITDQGLSHLSRLTDLEEFLIHGSRITDEGLEHLHGLTQLKRLWLVRTHVTQSGVRRLRSALPNCRITRYPRGHTGRRTTVPWLRASAGCPEITMLACSTPPSFTAADHGARIRRATWSFRFGPSVALTCDIFACASWFI